MTEEEKRELYRIRKRAKEEIKRSAKQEPRISITKSMRHKYGQRRETAFEFTIPQRRVEGFGHYIRWPKGKPEILIGGIGGGPISEDLSVAHKKYKGTVLSSADVRGHLLPRLRVMFPEAETVSGLRVTGIHSRYLERPGMISSKEEQIFRLPSLPRARAILGRSARAALKVARKTRAGKLAIGGLTLFGLLRGRTEQDAEI